MRSSCRSFSTDPALDASKGSLSRRDPHGRSSSENDLSVLDSSLQAHPHRSIEYFRQVHLTSGLRASKAKAAEQVKTYLPTLEPFVLAPVGSAKCLGHGNKRCECVYRQIESSKAILVNSSLEDCENASDAIASAIMTSTPVIASADIVKAFPFLIEARLLLPETESVPDLFLQNPQAESLEMPSKPRNAFTWPIIWEYRDI